MSPVYQIPRDFSCSIQITEPLCQELLMKHLGMPEHNLKKFAEEKPTEKRVRVDKVYFNNQHTTIVWSDGEKTTVNCMEGEKFDEYAGFAAAVIKRMFGSSHKAKKFLDAHKIVQQSKPKASDNLGGAQGEALHA